MSHVCATAHEVGTVHYDRLGVLHRKASCIALGGVHFDKDPPLEHGFDALQLMRTTRRFHLASITDETDCHLTGRPNCVDYFSRHEQMIYAQLT